MTTISEDAPGMKTGGRLQNGIQRLADNLADPASSRFTVLCLLAVYVVAWTVYGAIAQGNQDLPFDMAEQVAWSRELALGFLKHPPLAAALVKAWFTVLPVSDFAYYFLAMLVAAVGLWVAWMLSGEFIGGYKRVAGLALLSLLPVFNFQALKYNVNTVLIPLWAATTLWFLRSYLTRNHVYAALAGIGAAGAILGKYWSFFLLLGLVLAALTDHRRGRYLRSATPWITVVVGLMALSPHLIWLFNTRLAQLSHALAAHPAKPEGVAAESVPIFIAHVLAYAALPVAVTLYFSKTAEGAWRDILLPRDPNRRWAAIAFWIPLLIPIGAALVAEIEIAAPWTIAAWSLLPIVLLSSSRIEVSRRAAARLLAVALVFPLLMVVISPVIAYVVHREGKVVPSAAHSRLLAKQVAEQWHQLTTVPLQLVGGDSSLTYGVVTYMPDRPRAYPDLSSVPQAELDRDGAVAVCYAADSGCIAAARGWFAGDVRSVVSQIQRTHFGYRGIPRRYEILLKPPRETAASQAPSLPTAPN
ncbi:MAG TPA: glycosyltransferase family 39 protein [Xanthobacteraceae bacterium]|nr:glycosyltransferase family 39 protein [Xanthobacteraceae bacterium]